MMQGDQTDFLKVNPLYFKTYFTNDFLLFMVIMILIFCGAGLIADDLRHNALQLYFSRPLKKRDYLTGQAAVIFFFLFYSNTHSWDRIHPIQVDICREFSAFLPLIPG